MIWKKVMRVVLPLLIAFIAIAGQYINAVFSYKTTPHATSGVLNLAGWNQKNVFEIAGQWEFYWDRLLTATQIQSGAEAFEIVDAPGVWNEYETEYGKLHGHGRATYRIHVTGTKANAEYGIRIQNMSSVYRLYIDDKLLAQNGTFGDDASAPVSAYRPQLILFTPYANSFDLILQVSNDVYATGGMWEPIIFGTYDHLADFDLVLSGITTASFAVLIVMCILFLIFYAAQRQERDMLIWVGIGVIVLLQLAICAYSGISLMYLFPDMPITGIVRIDYLSYIWAQFLLIQLVYYNYSSHMRRWQIVALLSYAAAFSLYVLLLSFEAIAVADVILNLTLLFVIVYVTAKLARAAWQGQSDATPLLGTLSYILLSEFYYIFFMDYSISYYLLSCPAFICMILFFVQFIIIARRYHRAQRLEIAFLKGQIRPHFFHNSLACIISIARTNPNCTRELLQNMSSYLRSFYDYAYDDLITLKQELEFVHAYVNLEQLRFGDRFQVDYQIEADNILLPPLILQPLVENALVHGLREKEGGGTVIIYVRRMKNGKARISVKDNGLGFSGKLSQISRCGVGIENINCRLKKLFRTQLMFIVPDGGGCEVYMEIPWKEVNIDESISH